MEKQRLETFGDAIIAIVLTILVFIIDLNFGFFFFFLKFVKKQEV